MVVIVGGVGGEAGELHDEGDAVPAIIKVTVWVMVVVLQRQTTSMTRDAGNGIDSDGIDESGLVEKDNDPHDT